MSPTSACGRRPGRRGDRWPRWPRSWSTADLGGCPERTPEEASGRRSASVSAGARTGSALGSTAAAVPTGPGRCWLLRRWPAAGPASRLRLAGLGPGRRRPAVVIAGCRSGLGQWCPAGPRLRPPGGCRPAGRGPVLVLGGAVLASDLLEPVAGGVGGLLQAGSEAGSDLAGELADLGPLGQPAGGLGDPLVALAASPGPQDVPGGQPGQQLQLACHASPPAPQGCRMRPPVRR